MCHAVNCTVNCLVAFPSLITGASDQISSGLEHFCLKALLEPMTGAMQVCHGAPRHRALPPLSVDVACVYSIIATLSPASWTAALLSTASSLAASPSSPMCCTAVPAGRASSSLYRPLRASVKAQRSSRRSPTAAGRSMRATVSSPSASSCTCARPVSCAARCSASALPPSPTCKTGMSSCDCQAARISPA